MFRKFVYHWLPILMCAVVAVPLLALSAGAVERGHRLFARFDTDGDGRISQEEFKGPADRFEQLDTNNDGFIEPAELPGRGRGGRCRFMERFDANQDGSVTREEFMAHAEARFDSLDANGDGIIDAGEIPAPQGPPGQIQDDDQDQQAQ